MIQNQPRVRSLSGIDEDRKLPILLCQMNECGLASFAAFGVIGNLKRNAHHAQKVFLAAQVAVIDRGGNGHDPFALLVGGAVVGRGKLSTDVP